MTVWVENPFAGFQVGWTWAQHLAAGYLGGTDYIMYPPDVIRAAADGRVTLASGVNGFTPGSAVILALGDGRFVNYREVAHPVGTFPRNVKRDDVIGLPNKASRWPHIDATVGGVRVPFEPLVNLGLDPSGGGATPVPIPQGDDDMYYLRYTAANPNLWIAVDDVHQQYRVIPSGSWEDSRLNARDVAGTLVQENIGEPAWTNTFKSYTAVTSGAPTTGGGTVTVDLQPVLDAEAKTLAAVEAIKIPAATVVPTHITITGTGSLS